MPPVRISIITPCRNAERLVGRTVESIVEQSAVRSGRVGLEYLVVDGASTDGTVAAVRAAGGSGVEILSQPDRGMYDALAKGLRRCTGDVVGYLNAGDEYARGAFEVVADLFARPEVHWLTGMSVQCTEAGSVVVVRMPQPYRRRFLAKGAHDGVHLEFVQQESTFWRRSLQSSLDLDELASFSLAGDSWLWSRFARVADLYLVEAFLGGFTKHPGQLSERVAALREEISRFATPLSFPERLLAWFDWKAPAPVRLKRRLARGRLFRYCFDKRCWVRE